MAVYEVTLKTLNDYGYRFPSEDDEALIANEIERASSAYFKSVMSPSLYNDYKDTSDDPRWLYLFDPTIVDDRLYTHIRCKTFVIYEGDETIGLREGVNAYCAYNIIKAMYKRIGSHGVTVLKQESLSTIDPNQTMSDAYNIAGKAGDECITLVNNSEDYPKATKARGIARKTFFF